MKTSLRAFTLVELIVVIVILGILSTIGFVSYNGYLGGARDSNRITQMKNINDALNLYAGKNNLPLPDDYYSIFTAPNNLIGYQGYAGQSTLEIINYTSGGKDPKDEEYFTYYLSSDRKRVQLLGFLEEADGLDSFVNPFVSQAQAADYSLRFPKVYGKKLGVMVLAANNTPIQEDASFANGDVILSTGIPTAIYSAYYTDSDKVTGIGTTLMSIAANSSCDRIKQTGNGSGDGSYKINPTGVLNAEFEVYCDMNIGGGGWTLIGSKVTGGSNTKGAFGTQIIRQGTDTNVSIPTGSFLTTITEAMACSSQNCWTWTMTAAFKAGLTNGVTTTENNTLKKVSGTTGAGIVATNSSYNITTANPGFFEVNNSTSGVGGGATRRPMAGNATLGPWGAGEKWEFYVR